MADDSTSNGGHTRSFGQSIKHGVESKILIPVAVAVVSAAVSYLMKKLPTLLEEKVLPKLQEQDGGQVAKGAERTVESVAGTDQEVSSAAVPETQAAESPDMSNDAREQERRRREERRRERKRAIQKAA